jgi:hypothetical protein
MLLRNSSAFGIGIAGLFLSAAFLGIHSSIATFFAGPSLINKAALVRTLQLTDLCLFTEASYTRHLSMTDLNTPFQDSPLSFEHFPTGSLAAVPKHLTAVATRMVVKKHGQ